MKGLSSPDAGYGSSPAQQPMNASGHGVLRELKQVTSALTAGHSYTLTLISHDENNPGDATDTTYDDITTS